MNETNIMRVKLGSNLKPYAVWATEPLSHKSMITLGTHV